jgi:uncharacterized RmlC-like cupin family protein
MAQRGALFNRQVSRRMSLATREEIAAFIAAEFPQAKWVVQAVGDGGATVTHEIGPAELRPRWHAIPPRVASREAWMTETTNWRNGVTIVRAQSLASAQRGPAGNGRATAFDFAGTEGRQTWIGVVTLAPNGKTGTHHHGRHEVAIYVVRGHSEIRWGERLEFAADVGPGDFAYFAPHVPHQERNPSASEPVDFVVVRSDNERIVVPLDTAPVEQPETIQS